MTEPIASGVPDGFYVVRGECMSCGAPQTEAPAIMSQCTSGECVFDRQPETPDEVDSAIRAVWASCCGAVRYGGAAGDVLVRLTELGLVDQCDAEAPNVPQVQRTQALFECDTREAENSQLGEVILTTLMRSMQAGKDTSLSRCKAVGEGLAFRYSWAKGLLNGKEGCSVRISIDLLKSGRWHLQVSENERAAVGFAMRCDKVLRSMPSIQGLRWFTSEELARGMLLGRQHPY